MLRSRFFDLWNDDGRRHPDPVRLVPVSKLRRLLGRWVLRHQHKLGMLAVGHWEFREMPDFWDLVWRHYQLWSGHDRRWLQPLHYEYWAIWLRRR